MRCCWLCCTGRWRCWYRCARSRFSRASRLRCCRLCTRRRCWLHASRGLRCTSRFRGAARLRRRFCAVGRWLCGLRCRREPAANASPPARDESLRFSARLRSRFRRWRRRRFRFRSFRGCRRRWRSCRVFCRFFRCFCFRWRRFCRRRRWLRWNTGRCTFHHRSLHRRNTLRRRGHRRRQSHPRIGARDGRSFRNLRRMRFLNRRRRNARLRIIRPRKNRRQLRRLRARPQFPDQNFVSWSTDEIAEAFIGFVGLFRKSALRRVKFVFGVVNGRIVFRWRFFLRRLRRSRTHRARCRSRILRTKRHARELHFLRLALDVVVNVQDDLLANADVDAHRFGDEAVLRIGKRIQIDERRSPVGAEGSDEIDDFGSRRRFDFDRRRNRKRVNVGAELRFDQTVNRVVVQIFHGLRRRRRKNFGRSLKHFLFGFVGDQHRVLESRMPSASGESHQGRNREQKTIAHAGSPPDPSRSNPKAALNSKLCDFAKKPGHFLTRPDNFRRPRRNPRQCRGRRTKPMARALSKSAIEIQVEIERPASAGPRGSSRNDSITIRPTA